MKQKPEQSYTRKLEHKRRLIGRILLLFVLFILMFLIFFFVGATLTGTGGATLVAMTALLYILGDKILAWSDRYFAAAKRASKGADAEEEVQAILAGLRSEEFFVLNDIPSPVGNIDHLVIARHGGIFVIETKSSKGRVDSHDDQLILEGVPMPGDPIRQVLRNALWLKGKIGEILGEVPYITAVLLFTDAYIVVKKTVRGVVIARPQFLHQVLRTPPSQTSQSDRIWANRALFQETLIGALGMTDT